MFGMLTQCAVLLFVFWYCHKRGREVRLEKDRLLTEAEVETLNEPSPSSGPLTANAAEASIDKEAGTRSPESGQPSSGYAPEGSLAKELAKDEASKSNQAPHAMAVSQET